MPLSLSRILLNQFHSRINGNAKLQHTNSKYKRFESFKIEKQFYFRNLKGTVVTKFHHNYTLKILVYIHES